jgi:hypothetical protein
VLALAAVTGLLLAGRFTGRLDGTVARRALAGLVMAGAAAALLRQLV